jgi:DNA polymerase V
MGGFIFCREKCRDSENKDGILKISTIFSEKICYNSIIIEHTFVKMEMSSPVSIRIYSPDPHSKLTLPYAGNQITAGFPSPAEDYLEPALDLNKVLIKNPTSTFYGRVKGTSMKDAGVDHGDLLVIDKSLDYRDDDLAVCYLDGEFTLKKIKVQGNTLLLIPANQDYQPIIVKESAEFMVWGIVTYIIKRVY